ncbi:undecaprenyl/decaprenyl-phosphate alpha-N-acetylglucosaminyl 1-phosphate transferase [Pelagibacteraceae bacterium]|nr:undecaprenyl/decaprenyl-phosphate alpha-N-acetylglucosaminyl 1-phosphate transferase [Pelagibacteraceae bacterium]
MQLELIEFSFISIFTLITFFIFLTISKYSHKIKNGVLLDKDFSKPQAFHRYAISRSGGVAVMISLNIFFLIYYLIYSNILNEYIFICNFMFLIGFLDDIKFKVSPLKRLLLMIFSLFFSVHFMSIEVLNVDIPFLTDFLKIEIFSSIFVLFCFLFIINGANLVDGFNGLLTINLIIINAILLYINVSNENIEFSIFLIAQIIILISFLLFNFPHAKIFLGDSGSYLIGSLVALNTIITNNLNQDYSSFFFCTLLFYLFFEVFFSFLRKIVQKKSPIHPDEKHLHMLIFKKISLFTGKDKGNYINSIIINSVYFTLVLPALYFAKSPVISKYWFFSLIAIYLLTYLRLYRLTKN